MSMVSKCNKINNNTIERNIVQVSIVALSDIVAQYTYKFGDFIRTHSIPTIQCQSIKQVPVEFLILTTNFRYCVGTMNKYEKTVQKKLFTYYYRQLPTSHPFLNYNMLYKYTPMYIKLIIFSRHSYVWFFKLTIGKLATLFSLLVYYVITYYLLVIKYAFNCLEQLFTII